jgi:hypothetical protein
MTGAAPAGSVCGRAAITHACRFETSAVAVLIAENWGRYPQSDCGSTGTLNMTGAETAKSGEYHNHFIMINHTIA